MSSLIGVILDYCDDGTAAEPVALRAALGTGRAWADRCPDTKNMPYLLASEVSTVQSAFGSGYAWRIDDASVQFDVYATSGATVDAVLEAVEDCFAGPNAVTLTVTDRTHLTTYYANRLSVQDPNQDVFHGVLTLTFRLEKRPE